MSVHLEISIQKIKNSLLSLAAIVESQVRDSIDAFTSFNEDLAKKVIEKDDLIDQTEIDIEESCLQCLALYQPVAFDLRFVVSVLKINNDLERIGDLSVNIAERALSLGRTSLPKHNIDYFLMSQKVIDMLKQSIDSFIAGNSELARKICLADKEVDEIHQKNYSIVESIISSNNGDSQAISIMQLMSISRYIERIADLATNIAEDVIYIVEGKIQRHKIIK